MTLSIIIKSTIVLLSVMLAARLLHRSRAAVRHLALAAGFGVLLALPLASAIAPISVAVSVPVPTAPRTWMVQPVNELIVGVPERPASDGSYNFGFDRLLFIAWVAGVLASLAPVLAGLVQLRSLRRAGLPNARGQAVANTFGAEIGLRRTSLVVSHPNVTGPVIAVTAPLTMKAQAGQVEKLEFDAASIKRNNSGDDERYFKPTPGRFYAYNVTPMMLVTYAYNLRDFQVIGAPDWMLERRYNIEATAADGAAWQLQARMLQSVLADRFKLALHREKRNLPVYSLRVADGGLKISSNSGCVKSTPGSAVTPSDRTKTCGFVGIGRESFQAAGATMSATAEGLSMVLDRMVLDRAGLSGEFDIALKWNSAEGPSIFTAIQEQLGLRLDADRGPVEVVVIESAEQPSDN